MPVIRNAPKPCSAPNPQTRHITRTSLPNVVIDVHQSLCTRNLHPWEEGCFQREGFWTSVYIYCPLGDGLDRSQCHTHGNQWGSSSFMWLGRWGNVCQAGGMRAGAGLAVSAAGRIRECLDNAFPDSYLSIHAAHLPVLLHVLPCDSSPRAGEDPVRKSWH